MRLDREGIETVHWPYVADVDDLGTVKVKLADTWYDAALEDGNVVLLVAGPDAEDPGDAVVLSLGPNSAKVQFVDHPELVVRGGGTIHVR
jgi:hypothetical protein